MIKQLDEQNFYTVQFFEQYSRIHFKQGLSTNIKKNIYKNRTRREVSQPIRKELSEILISDWLAVQSTIKEAAFCMLTPFNELKKVDHLKLLSESFYEQSSL